MYSNYRNKKRVPSTISTASLPDIVFMLLFFFMTVTTVKNQNLLVKNDLPKAKQITKLEKKDRVIEIFIGKPNENLQEQYGSEPVVQLNDRIQKIENVSNYVLAELAKKPDEIRNMVTVSLKVDKETSLGIVADIKEQLRQINVLKVNYTVIQGER